jgi:hypothetical protein
MGEQRTAADHRRLSDRIIAAFDIACERRDAEIADALYKTLELVLTRQGGADNPDRRLDVAFIHNAAAKLHRLHEDLKAA